MAIYKKTNDVVRAWQWNGTASLTTAPQWLKDLIASIQNLPMGLVITGVGTDNAKAVFLGVTVLKNQYIVRGADGNITAVDPDEFNAGHTVV